MTPILAFFWWPKYGCSKRLSLLSLYNAPLFSINYEKLKCDKNKVSLLRCKIWKL